MRTIIRDNYEPHLNDYHDKIVKDEVNNRIWLFDCDGVYLNVSRTWLKVVNELGENDENFVPSQALITRLIEEARADMVAEAEARQSADTELTERIDKLEASTDVKDVVGTYAELQSYPTATLGDNDIIKVLQDETNNGATTYYRWNKTEGKFDPIGELGPYYTKEETDALLDTKLTATSLKTVNGESLVGEGNIEIKGSEGHVDAALTISYYKNYSLVYTAGWGMECTVQSVDSVKAGAFIKENGIGYPQFRYEETPEGYAWAVDTNSGTLYIPQDEMEERTGINVTLDYPGVTWAEFDLQESYEIDKSEQTTAYSIPFTDWQSLVNYSGQNALLGPFSFPDGETYLPARVITSIQISNRNGQVPDHVPNYFAAYMYNLRSISFIVKNVGDSFCYSSGGESGGLDCSIGVFESIGKEFLSRSSVSNSALTFYELKSVGNGFMKYAKCPNLTRLDFTNLVHAGDDFMNQVTTAAGFKNTSHYFPRLETVGNAFFQDTPAGVHVYLPTLVTAGDAFFAMYNSSLQSDNEYLMIPDLPSLVSLGSNAFLARNVGISSLTFNSLVSVNSGFMERARITVIGSNSVFKFPVLKTIETDYASNRGFMSNMTTTYTSLDQYDGIWLEFPALNFFVLDSDRSFRSTSPAGNPFYDNSVAPYGGIRVLASASAARVFHEWFKEINTIGAKDSNAALVGILPPESHDLSEIGSIPRWWHGLPVGAYTTKDSYQMNNRYVNNVMLALYIDSSRGANRTPNFSGNWEEQIPYKIGKVVDFSVDNVIAYMQVNADGNYSDWKTIQTTN